MTESPATVKMVNFVESSSSSESEANLCENGSTGECSETPSVKEEQLAKKETRAVFRLRRLVFLALLAAALAVSVIVYLITKKAEDDEFKAQFYGSAEKLLESFEGVISQKIEAIGSMGITLAAYAESQNTSFPFVTMNSFQQRSASARQLSAALLLFLTFIVTDEDRAAYEHYTWDNQGWIEEGRAFQEEVGLDAFLTRRSLAEGGLAPLLWGDRGLQMDKTNNTEAEGPPFEFRPFSVSTRIFEYTKQFKPVLAASADIYTPMWQSSPVLAATQANVVSARGRVSSCASSGGHIAHNFEFVARNRTSLSLVLVPLSRVVSSRERWCLEALTLQNLETERAQTAKRLFSRKFSALPPKRKW